MRILNRLLVYRCFMYDTKETEEFRKRDHEEYSEMMDKLA